MDIRPLHFKDSGEWRHWLLQNHDKVKETWLAIRKKNSGGAGVSYGEALEEALCFGWIDGRMQSLNDTEFIQRFSPRKNRSLWSKRNKEKAEQLIAQGRMTGTGLAKIEEAKKNGLWDTTYSSMNREEVPADLEEALSITQIAWKNFHNTANTYRNMFIRWLNGAGTEEIRRERVAEIVKRAELNQKLRYGKI